MEELEKEKAELPTKRVGDPELEIENIDQRIKELEFQMETSTLPKDQAKRVVSQIEKLTSAKLTLRGWKEKHENVKSLRSEADQLLTKIDRNKDAIKELGDNEKQLTGEIKDVKTLINGLKEIIDKKKEENEQFQQQLKQNTQDIEDKKQNVKQQKDKFYNEQIEPSKKEDQDTLKKSESEGTTLVNIRYKTEIETCTELIQQLKNLLSANKPHKNQNNNTTNSEGNKESEEANDKSFKLNFPFDVIVKFEMVSSEVPTQLKDLKLFINGLQQRKEYYASFRGLKS